MSNKKFMRQLVSVTKQFRTVGNPEQTAVAPVPAPAKRASGFGAMGMAGSLTGNFGLL